MSGRPFSRYTLPEGSEVEYQPGSGRRVLRNKLDIRSKRDMDIREARALEVVQASTQSIIETREIITAERICYLHRLWLQDLYDWAGHYRIVSLTKDDFTWPPADMIDQNMAYLEKSMLRPYTPCRPQALPTIARQIAEVHATLLFIHPFREGNGRIARLVADLMAQQAGFPPADYPFKGRGARMERENYLKAVKAGYNTKYDALAIFFQRTIELAKKRKYETDITY